jgi:hypothetical protein
MKDTMHVLDNRTVQGIQVHRQRRFYARTNQERVQTGIYNWEVYSFKKSGAKG